MRVFWFAILLGLTVPWSAAATVLTIQPTAELEVFTKPDLKSAVVERVNAGAVIRLKTDKVVGVGGLGVFYKVKTQSGLIGYVVDADILTANGEFPKPMANPPPMKRAQHPNAVPSGAPSSPPTSTAVPASREKSLWGMSAGGAQFTEKFEEQVESAFQMFFGIRWTGRRRSVWSLTPDAGFVVSPFAPKFLSAAGASGETKGFITLGDFSLLYDFIESKKLAVFAGAGPLLGFSKYSTHYAGQPKESSSLKVGGVLDLGTSVDFRSGVVRLDARYFIAAQSFVGAFLTIQLFL